MRADVGYTFLGLGGLYQVTHEATIMACHRFGTEKVMSVIATAIDPCPVAPLTIEGLRNEILEETGVAVTDDDISFLGKIAEASTLIREATRRLEEARKVP